MKEVIIVESRSKFSIDLKVKNKNINKHTIIITRITVVFGLFSRLKNGPIIVKINPKVDEMKNLGNLNILSQKSDILNNCEILND
jgi:hypothetical protein